MKKQLLFLFILATGIQNLVAQYVTIPDSAFRSELKKLYPSCFNSFDLMDTTCSQIVSETEMNINFSIRENSNRNIEGIQYFDNLTSLFVGGNGLNSVATKFPPKLKTFACELGYIKQLPPLPLGLTFLDVVGNELTSLPPLPKTLEYLYMHKNQVKELGPLPPNLKTLFCLANNIRTLPTLPEGLEVLGVGGNPLNCLPRLPSSLKQLIISKDTTPCLPNQVVGLEVYTTIGTIYANMIDRVLTTVPVCSQTFDPKLCKFDVVTNINSDLDRTLSVSIYPNPAQDRIWVNIIAPQQFSLYNSSGDLVLQKELSDAQELDITELHSGFYYYKLGDHRGKFVIE